MSALSSARRESGWPYERLGGEVILKANQGIEAVSTERRNLLVYSTEK
jgi:hypothetical protein